MKHHVRDVSPTSCSAVERYPGRSRSGCALYLLNMIYKGVVDQESRFKEILRYDQLVVLVGMQWKQ